MRMKSNNGSIDITVLGWGEKFLPFEELQVSYFVGGRDFEIENDVKYLNQVHSNKCVIVNSETRESLINVDADAMITDTNDFIAVKTADCVPILITNAKGSVVACVHAGWRGLVSGVIENTLDKFESYGSKTEDLRVLIGPCIGFDEFEVGEEVVAEFEVYTNSFDNFFEWHRKKTNGKSIISLHNVCLNLLLSKGIIPKNIGVVDVCTKSSESILHSYRRDGRNAGRNWTGVKCAIKN